MCSWVLTIMNGVLCVNCSDVFAGKDWGKGEEQSFSVWAVPSRCVAESFLVMVYVKSQQCICRRFIKSSPNLLHFFSQERLSLMVRPQKVSFCHFQAGLLLLGISKQVS